MHEKLREYFEDARRSDSEQVAQELIAADLYEKVYSPVNEYSDEFPYSEWDENVSQLRYYKKVPITISYADYEKFKKIYDSSKLKPTNPVSTALKIIAWTIYIAGFIAGIYFGNVGFEFSESHADFSFATAIIFWAIALINGTLFLGFAEVIKLLNDIKNK